MAYERRSESLRPLFELYPSIWTHSIIVRDFASNVVKTRKILNYALVISDEFPQYVVVKCLATRLVNSRDIK